MSCFHLSRGAFGNRNGSWVLSLVGLVEEHCLFGGGSAKGFYTGDLRRTVDFQVVATGSQHLPFFYFKYELYQDLEDF